MTGKSLIYNLFLLLFFAFLTQSVSAQDPRFQATASKTTLSEGDRVRIEYTLNASGDQFSPPKFEGFRILSGPNQSTNMQFINGRSSYSISFSYVLMALKEGEFNIPSASIKVGSENVNSNDLNIKVVKGSAPAQQQQNNQQNANKNQTEELYDDNVDENIFMTASVSNNKPFVGEQITAIYKLYFNMNIVDNSFTTLPSLTGFWSEDLEVQNNSRETEVVKGKKYNVATLKKTILIPQRAGDLELDPLEMDLVIQQPVQSRSRNLFDQFFGNYKNVKVSVKNRPVKVQVRSLPAGRTSNFDGSVGNFNIKLVADRSTVKANEAINLSYEISGKGNLKLLKEPNINFPSDFEVYDPKVEDNIAVSGNGMAGTRTYKYLVIPRHKGVFTIEPVSFVYFDPNKESYQTITTSELIFDVEKGEEESAGAINFSQTNKEDIKLLGSDIRFIKTSTILLPVGYSFFGSLLHYILWFLPLPLILLAWRLKLNISAKRSNLVYMRKSKANKLAIKRLSSAHKIMATGDDKKFYEEIFKALYGFFGDKFNLKTAEINKERIRQALTSSGVEESLILKSEDLLNRCEMARFAPVSDVSHEQVYQDSISLLSAIQKEVK